MSISVEQFANLNDQQLYQLAEFQTAMTSDKKDIGSNPLIYAIPVVDSFTRASMAEGTLGPKSLKFTKSMAGWAGVFALANVFNKGLNALYKKSPQVRDFKENHPVLSTIIEWGGFWFAMTSAYRGADKIAVKLKNKFPNKAAKLSKFTQNLSNKIDNSWIDKKIYKPICNAIKVMEKKTPTLMDGAKYLLPLATPFLVIAAISKSISAANEIKDKTIDNFEQLKTYQNEIRDKIHTQSYF